MIRRTQQNGEDYQRLLSVDHRDQFDEEERIGQDGQLPLDRNDIPFSSNIAIPTEEDTGVISAGNKNEPEGSSDTARSNDKLYFTTEGDRLSITFVKAKLEENYGLSRMDPYCVLKVGSKELKTHTSKNGSTNPNWGESLECYVPPSVCYIFIEIFDQNTFISDDKIAWTFIPIERLVESGNEKVVWYDLSGKKGRNKEGKLQLITTYKPNACGRVPQPLLLSVPSQSTAVQTQQEEPSQQNMDPTELVATGRNDDGLTEGEFNSIQGKLTITCMEAQLENNYGILPMDPYCVIKVGSQEWRTSICRKGSTKPVWNETFECLVSSGDCIISIEIFDSNSVTSDKKVAWTFILTKEIIQTVGETTKWYRLSGELGEEKEGKIQLRMDHENPYVDNDGEGLVPLEKISTFSSIGKRCLSDYTGKVPDKINIILVGRGGNGKSSVGNTILGKECFSTREGQNTLQLAKLQIRNFEVNVMDTPNLFDQHQQMEIGQKVMEIVKTAMDFPDGIHLFLIVCRGDVRLHDEEEKMLTELEKKYGESIYDHVLLVLTHAKDFLREKSLDEVLKKNKDLWNVCTHVRGRVIAIENIQEELPEITKENQQTQLLRTIFEVIRLQHEPYRNHFFHAVNEQIIQREKHYKGTMQAYDIVFDHIVHTISRKSETNICEILTTNDFAIDGHVLRSNDACPNKNIIRQVVKWCIKDLETFINLVLTEKRLKQLSNGDDDNDNDYATIEKYKERSCQTSKLIKANRQKLMFLFNTDVEEKVRGFLRCKELSEIDKIINDVDKNNIADCEIYTTILESLPEHFKSEEWIADIKYLGLQTLHEYSEIKDKVWPNPLLLTILGQVGVTAGYASVLGAVGVAYAVANGFIMTTGAAAVAVATFGTAGIALLLGAGIAGTTGGIFLLRKAISRSQGNKED